MVGACINVAESSDHSNVWTGKPPAEFGTGLAQLKTDYASASATAAQADAATGGASDAKAVAETALEDAAYLVARALALHFKKTGDLDRRGKVDFNKSAIQRLTNQEIVARATEIRDLASTAQSESGATDRGLTAERIAGLTTAINNYQNVMSKPRGQIVNRGTLLKELETDAADLLDQLHDLDDLVLQFDGTDAGQRFSEAWRRARSIVDVGHGPSEKPTPSPTPAPAPAAVAAK